MGKLSDEDKATLDRLQKMQEAPDEDDDTDYIWVRTENGHTIRLHGERARSYCRRHGIDLDEAEDSTQAAPATPKKGAQPAKKAPAKKTGTPAADVEDGEELEDGEQQDAPPPQSRPRAFF